MGPEQASPPTTADSPRCPSRTDYFCSFRLCQCLCPSPRVIQLPVSVFYFQSKAGPPHLASSTPAPVGISLHPALDRLGAGSRSKGRVALVTSRRLSPSLLHTFILLLPPRPFPSAQEHVLILTLKIKSLSKTRTPPAGTHHSAFTATLLTSLGGRCTGYFLPRLSLFTTPSTPRAFCTTSLSTAPAHSKFTKAEALSG